MTDARLERLMSLVLAIGVIVSAVLITLGFAASFVVGWAGSLTGAALRAADATDFSGLLSRLADLQPLAFAQAGLVVLIATPVVRVAVTALGFWRERDALYAVITLAVLALLVASFVFVR
ncbi:MAG TPA: DUF1634 domain-containing protein [Candidatus Limnocylindrales bacterium]|jgi:uncharacterized membrane protein